MANTTNFGWETPDDTDLVKDGAAAMRTLGNSIDASFVDLKGGTTGQVLAKASNTDLDFTWSNDAGISPTIFDAKADLLTATAADTPARLAVGANGTVLTADSSEATGLKWSAPAGALAIAQIASGSLTSGTKLQLTGLSSYDTLIFRINNFKWNTGSNPVYMRINDSSSTVYDQVNGRGFAEANYILRDSYTSAGALYVFDQSMRRDATNTYIQLILTNCKSAGFTTGHWMGSGQNSNNFNLFTVGNVIFKSAAAVSSLELFTSDSYTFSSGDYVLWGA